jgi:predicted TIM-barrel fold metal-dependent hydrolase
MRIVDCHSHFGTERGYLFRTPEALASQERIWKTKVTYHSEQQMADYFRKNDVRVILDIAWPGRLPIPEWREEYRYALDVQRAHPDAIIGNWVGIDARRGKAGVKALSALVEESDGFIGFGIHGTGYGGIPASDPRWKPYLDFCNDAGVTVLIHTGLTGIGQGTPGGGGLVLDHLHPRHVDWVAAHYPDMKILAGRPSYPWQDDMIAILLHKANVQYELHGWSPKYLTDNLKKEIAGRLQDRVMFGCDYPVLRYEKVVGDWESLGLKPAVLEKVLHKNAEAYFSLK